MQLRLTSRVLAGAAALALATTLSSCGFDYATDRNYTPGSSTNHRDADIDVLGAVVVSGQEGSGTFIATFANNITDEAGSVESLTATTIPSGDEEAADLEVAEFTPVEVPPHGMVNLADEGGIVLTGDVASGDFVTVTIGFGNGETAEVEVPVMPNCDEYAGLDESAESDSEEQCTIEAPEHEGH